MSRSWSLAIVAIVGALTIAAYLLRSSQESPTATDVVPRSSAETQAPAPAISVQTVRIDLDLRNARPKNRKSNSADPLVLPRRRLHASIVLPSDFATAECDVEIRGADGRPHATTSGIASIQEGAAILRTTLDLAALPPGAYHLAVRRDGRDWQSLPVHLK
jgi:hypothetical protein